MNFTQEQFALARRIKSLFPHWKPSPGSYVLGEGEASIARPTPFQKGVHLVVWPERFIEESGGAEAFKRDYAWLPTWDDGRDWLRAKGVPDATSTA